MNRITYVLEVDRKQQNTSDGLLPVEEFIFRKLKRAQLSVQELSEQQSGRFQDLNHAARYNSPLRRHHSYNLPDRPPTLSGTPSVSPATSTASALPVPSEPVALEPTPPSPSAPIISSPSETTLPSTNKNFEKPTIQSSSSSVFLLITASNTVLIREADKQKNKEQLIKNVVKKRVNFSFDSSSSSFDQDTSLPDNKDPLSSSASLIAPSSSQISLPSLRFRGSAASPRFSGTSSFQFEKYAEVASPRDDTEDEKLIGYAPRELEEYLLQAILNVEIETREELEYVRRKFSPLTIKAVIKNKQKTEESDPFGSTYVSLGDSLIKACEEVGIVVNLFPLHQPNERDRLWNDVLFSPIVPVESVMDYCGAKTSLYFAFLQFFWNWLMILGLTSGVIYFLQTEFHVSDTLDSIFIPIYALFLIFWALLFVVFWNRRNNTLCFGWSLLAYENIPVARPQFYGEYRISQITNKRELYFSPWKRWQRGSVSSMIIFMIFLICVVIMVICSYLKDQIQDLSFITEILRLPSSSAIFNALKSLKLFFQEVEQKYVFLNQGYHNFLPYALHCMMISCFNSIFTRIAKRLNDWENYKTQDDYEVALILKKSIFICSSTFMSAAYLAFWERDIAALKTELMALFIGDNVLHFIFSFFLPLLAAKTKMSNPIKRLRSHFDDAKYGVAFQKINKSLSSQQFKDVRVDLVSDEIQRREYDDFDDWVYAMKMIGFITLFSAVHPSVCWLAIIFIFVQIRTNMYKRLYLSRRNSSIKVSSIGPWKTVLKVITNISLLTNCGILSYTSNQAISVLNEFFIWAGKYIRRKPRNTQHSASSASCFYSPQDELSRAIRSDQLGQEGLLNNAGTDTDTVLTIGTPSLCVSFAIVLILENMILMFKWLLTKSIDENPNYVRTMILKNNYRRERAINKMLK